MSNSRELSKIFTADTIVTTHSELITTAAAASANAMTEAMSYVDSELSSIDLTSTIITASAAAASYTDSAIASFEALPSQTGNAGKYLSTDGSITSWETLDLNSAIQTASAGAVTYLVDSAPSTLDTLNELAAALGDDPNYATTITNLLASKLNSSTASTLYLPLSSSTVFYRWTKTYSSSASVITGSDDLGNTLDYDAGYLQLFVNGVMLDPTEYTASNGTSITINSPIQSGEIVDIFIFSNPININTYSQAQVDAKYNSLTRWKKTYGSSASVITGVDDNALSLSYISGYESVYLNGILLIPIVDYSRTNSSTITLNEEVVTNDILEIITTQPFNIVDTYTTSQADSLFEKNIQYVSASPSGPSTGTLWIDSTASAAPILKVYNGTEWIAVSGAGGGGLKTHFLLMGA